MGNFQIHPSIDTFIDHKSKVETAVIGLLAKEEFVSAQDVVMGLRVYGDYQEWCESCEGFQIGLTMAGVEVKLAPVTLTPFLAWCRITQTPLTERALNAFASIVLFFQTSTKPLVLAVVPEKEFDAGSLTVAEFSQHCDYRQWLMYRQMVREQAAKSGARIEEISIVVCDFVAWSACVGRTYEPSIDRFALLTLERLVHDFDAPEPKMFPDRFDLKSFDN